MNKSLFKYAQEGDLKNVKKLLKEGYDPNKSDNIIYLMDITGEFISHHITLLEWACKYDKINLVKLLIKYNCDMNKHVYYKSLLHISNNFRITKCLIEAGYNINEVNDQGNTLLMRACYHKNYDLVKYLIQKGCDLDKQNGDRDTALIIASGDWWTSKYIENNIYKIMRLLIDAGCNVNLRDVRNSNALTYVCLNEYKDVIRLLILNYADLYDDSTKNSYKYWVIKYGLTAFVNEAILDTGLKGVVIRYIVNNYTRYRWNINILPKDIRTKIKLPHENYFTKIFNITKSKILGFKNWLKI